MKRKEFCDCNHWAWCCAGFGLGIVLAVFASLKLVLILAGGAARPLYYEDIYGKP